ncbi:MAG: protein-glutamate methylesterase/protein-glutamine glutaminase [Pyrinomonadaceae bacterium]
MSSTHISAQGAPPAAVRVMIVDDSALMRKLLTQVLERDACIKVVDTAMDGQFALDHLKKVRPDVVLMDVDMPRLDGLGALDQIVAEYRLPVVMCSTRTTAGAAATLEALSRGAVDFVEKPSLSALTTGAATAEIAARVRGAVGARVRPSTARKNPAEPAAAGRPVSPGGVQPSSSTAAGAAHAGTPGWQKKAAQLAARAKPEIVAIGTSTGGPPALEQVLGGLPADYPYGIVIVQHMPAGFTAMLASHLDRTSRLTVREARHGEEIRPGVALVAPGGTHLRVERSGGGGYTVSLDATRPLVSGHRPSVDVLFESVAAAAGGRAVGVVMTGMGSDGAEGLGRLTSAGAVTVAQTPDSSICFGMPKSAIDRGHAALVVPLEEIAQTLIQCIPHAN